MKGPGHIHAYENEFGSWFALDVVFNEKRPTLGVVVKQATESGNQHRG